MTDLERAHKFMQEHFDCQDVICTFAAGCSCAAEIAALVAATRREGVTWFHFLLFAVDAYVATDQEGKVTEARNGLALEGWQKIRDCLFEMHEHPETRHEP